MIRVWRSGSGIALPRHIPECCPIFVGRARQLETLVNLLCDAAAGHGHVVVLSGSDGVGKTRLCAELPPHTRLALTACCLPPEWSVPYAELLELFESAPGHSALAPAVEALKAIDTLQQRDGRSQRTIPLDPGYPRRRLFALLAECLRNAAAEGPVLITLDDLQWADESLLAFASFLAPQVRSLPLLLVLAVHSDDECRDHARLLDGPLAGVEVAQVHLEPMCLGELGTLTQAMFALPGPCDELLLRRLFAFSEGNAYLAEEALFALAAAGDFPVADGSVNPRPPRDMRLPGDALEAMRWRTDRLAPVTRRGLQLAAVAGPCYEVGFLTALLSRHEEAGEEAAAATVYELVAARFLAKRGSSRLGFRHALLHRTALRIVEDEELPIMHGAVAATLVQHYAGALAPRQTMLAHHYTAVGDWHRALEAAREAADHALAVFAPHAAIADLTCAITAATALDAPTGALSIDRGQAYQSLGEFERAREDYESANALAREFADRRTEWRSLVALGDLWAGRDEQRSGRFYERAHQVARTLDDPGAVALTLHRLGRWLIVMDRAQDAEHMLQSALALVRQHEVPQSLGEALFGLATARLLSGQAVQAAADFDECSSHVCAGEDRHLLCSAMAMRAVCGPSALTEFAHAAQFDQAGDLADARLALDLAQELGWRTGEAWALLSAAAVLSPRGEYADALALANDALAIAERDGTAEWIIAALWLLGTLYRALMVFPEARQKLQCALSLAREIGSRHWIHSTVGTLATIAIMQGEFAEAGELLDSAGTAEGSSTSFGQRALACARVELWLARGEPQLALDLLDRCGGADASVAVVPRLARLRADALAALGHPAEAEATLRSARQAVVAAGLRGTQWYLGIAWARLLHMQRREAEAARAVQSTRALIEELAAGVPDPAFSEPFRRRALAMLPPASSPASRKALKEVFDGLTGREREVASLIALGRSNRAIAEALVVSERTAETHVGNILKKLGFSSRAQIATWASAKQRSMRDE